jgi:UDP-MurNAc hydroxylase
MVKPNIHFINHASYALEFEDVYLLVDPWITGTAFNLGWSLQLPTPERYMHVSDKNPVTHILFTHEHPDHFSPSWLASIPDEKRKDIVVIFQKTKDRRVLNFCQKLGFQTIELPEAKRISLSADLALEVKPIPFIDSLNVVTVGGFTIVNLNDCVTSKSDLNWIKKKYNVDVLLSQFSYANWAGNPEELVYRQDLARETLQKFINQIEVLQPKFVIPFASFVFFSHIENVHLNDSRVGIKRVHNEIIRKTSAHPIILAPGEVWEVGSTKENESSISIYEKSEVLEEHSVTTNTTKYSLEELVAFGEDFGKRRKIQNNQLALKIATYFPFKIGRPIKIFLTDLRLNVVVNPSNGRLFFYYNEDPAEIEMSSESFAFLLKFDYGSDTLSVNGRFRSTQENYKKLLKAFSIANLNNGGRSLSLNLFLEWNFVRQAVKRIIAG